MTDQEEQGMDALPPPAGIPDTATRDWVPLTRNETLELLSVPLDAAAAGEGLVPEGLASRAAAWVAEAAARGEPAVSLPLYGTFVAWSGVRAALIGPADRLERMREAVLEFSTLAHELRFIERDLGAALVHVEADSGLAFEFDERAISRRGELAERFRQAVAIRRRLVELAPAIHRPALHPPTLASQIGERLRERTRIADRLEFAGHQAELVERVYEGCGQRASDFMLARRQTMLEWAIVVLLTIETVILLVDLLTVRRA